MKIFINYETYISTMDVEDNLSKSEQGEKIVLNHLKNKFPTPKFTVVDFQDVAEVDFLVIDNQKEKIIEIHEVKTTETDTKCFKINGDMQYFVFDKQRILKKHANEFPNKFNPAPFFLDIVRINKDLWIKEKQVKVERIETYGLDQLETNKDGTEWILK